MGVLRNIVNDNKFTPDRVPPFEAKLFFEGAKRRVDLERFAVLLFLSTVIATYGVLGNSTATVIGAMIIAPLMTPIMPPLPGWSWAIWAGPEMPLSRSCSGWPG